MAKVPIAASPPISPSGSGTGATATGSYLTHVLIHQAREASEPVLICALSGKGQQAAIRMAPPNLGTLNRNTVTVIQFCCLQNDCNKSPGQEHVTLN